MYNQTLFPPAAWKVAWGKRDFDLKPVSLDHLSQYRLSAHTHSINKICKITILTLKSLAWQKEKAKKANGLHFHCPDLFSPWSLKVCWLALLSAREICSWRFCNPLLLVIRHHYGCIKGKERRGEDRLGLINYLILMKERETDSRWEFAQEQTRQATETSLKQE